MSGELTYRDLILGDEGFAELLFVRAIVQAKLDRGITHEEFTKMLNHCPGEPFTISLMVNGVELPFLRVVGGLKEMVYRLARNYSEELVDSFLREKARRVEYQLERIRFGLEKLIDEELKSYVSVDPEINPGATK